MDGQHSRDDEDDWTMVKWRGVDPDELERLPPSDHLPWRPPRRVDAGEEEE